MTKYKLKNKSVGDRAGTRIIPPNKLNQKFGKDINLLIEKISQDYGYESEEVKQSLIEVLKH